MNSTDVLLAALGDLAAVAPTAMAGTADPLVRLEGLEEWRVDPDDPSGEQHRKAW